MGNGSMVRVNVLRIDIKSQVQSLVEKYGEKTCNDIKDASPRRPHGGEYAEGWVNDIIEDTAVVHNVGRDKSLTHLLELGHATKNGGFVAPQEHIRPAYLKNKEEYLNELKSIKIKPQ
ncbi:HK97 gp10 family phage protein [Streptococcus sp. ZY19097]|uniref:HK97 gp10 family phage protein n=2 Tax=Streptococcus TaxID=1301 RepID=UPI0029437CF0|nr:HK97 gp10 family phage protein [Streptococcus orisratti]